MSKNIKDFKARLSTDKKFKNKFIVIILACIIIIAAAITIPICIHNNNVKNAEAQTTEVVETTAETTTEIETTTIPDGVETTVIEENGTTRVQAVLDENGSFVYTTVATTAPVTDSGNNNASSNGNSNSGNNTKTTTTKKASTTSAPQTTAAPANTFVWTDAEADSVVAQAKAYARSKGFKIYEDSKKTVTINGQTFETSWDPPTVANPSSSLSTKQKALDGIFYDIDEINSNNSSLAFLHDEEGIGINIFYEKVYDGGRQAEVYKFYVVR